MVTPMRANLLAALIICLTLLVTVTGNASEAWKRPGCHKIGFTRIVKIPHCVEFPLTTNACRGYCESYAIPSPVATLAANPHHMFTSRAECCSIADTHDVKASVLCFYGGVRDVVFKSARSCRCSICRRF